MRILYVFRSPGTGHSIEELFGSIRREMSQQPGVQSDIIQLPHISQNWWSVWYNLRYLWGLKADVFHITGDVHYAALVLPVSRLMLTIHDCSLLKKNRHRPVRYVLFWLLWYYWPIRRARRVTVVSEKTRQELIQYVGSIAQKATVVANGCDPAFVYRPVTFRKDYPILFQLGTASHKNLPRLLAAIEGISCLLIIVGPLTDDTLQELINRRINYRHYTNLNRIEVIRLYEACDIVTFVSTYEGFGMPVLEANAVGRVVITSAIAPMNVLAAGAAHFVDPTNITAIRQGILRLIQDDVYRQQLLVAGQQNAQRYSAAHTAVQYATLYRELAEVIPLVDAII